MSAAHKSFCEIKPIFNPASGSNGRCHERIVNPQSARVGESMTA
jgi:hypothetical protein